MICIFLHILSAFIFTSFDICILYLPIFCVWLQMSFANVCIIFHNFNFLCKLLLVNSSNSVVLVQEPWTIFMVQNMITGSNFNQLNYLYISGIWYMFKVTKEIAKNFLRISQNLQYWSQWYYHKYLWDKKLCLILLSLKLLII